MLLICFEAFFTFGTDPPPLVFPFVSIISLPVTSPIDSVLSSLIRFLVIVVLSFLAFRRSVSILVLFLV